MRLAEICEINMGQSPESSSYNESGEGMPFFQGNADFGELHPKVRIWCNAPTKIAECGDILISVRAPIGALNIADKQCCIGRGLAALTVNDTLCDPKYLWYGLECKVDELNSKGTGSTFKAINKKTLAETEIPLPPLEEQRKIAAVLDNVSDLIAKRRTQLDKLDELVKSRFIEMFGDANKFESTPLHDSVEEMFIGPFGSSLKNECFVTKDQGYCMVYEQKHAIKKTMNVATRYVDENKYKELRRFTVQGGDIIVSCRGTIGETFIVPDDAPMGIMHPSIMKIRLNPIVYDQVFFNHLLQSVLAHHITDANGSGVKMAITASALGKEYFIRPPIEIQKLFSSFVKSVDKSKLTIQKSLQKLEILKKALMQKYFG